MLTRSSPPRRPPATAYKNNLATRPSDLSSSVSSLFSQPAVSAGCGLMYKHSIVRLEFNVGVPLVAHKSDGTRKGIQVGLGLHFL